MDDSVQDQLMQSEDDIARLGVPVFLSWSVYSWEDELLRSRGVPLPTCLRHVKSFLPRELTAEIFETLTAQEAVLLRWTEPAPPLRFRLVRDSFVSQGSVALTEFFEHAGHKEGGLSLDHDFSRICLSWDHAVREGIEREFGTTVQAAGSKSVRVPTVADKIRIGYRLELEIKFGDHLDSLGSFSGLFGGRNPFPQTQVGWNRWTLKRLGL